MFYFLIFITFILMLLLIGTVVLIAFQKTRKAGIISTSIIAPIFLVLLVSTIMYGNKPDTEGYKASATSYSFWDYLDNKVDDGEIVVVKGTASAFEGNNIEKGDTFSISDGEGLYYVLNNDDGSSIKDGDEITIYGGYDGLDNEEGLPTIAAQIIE
ncbi:hypothetical protein E2R51_02420 [Jeotgalibacillus sp. S-D1]|uniref:hypothetical protein n=1 Tax=Jeotgalibacillus sp. S-D1 TaxID=2552189 RepID=UPI001059B2C0|nr:hypothetical protein [Jeotgalibacillus sp. S-D1]TDL34592.1 hypothetical protein E2R51_02420 [Jeotgalibacillus sp. S-D1]